MTEDCFRVLGVPRRPWFSDGELESRFHELTALHHPDRVHSGDVVAREQAGDRFSEINGAYQKLRDVKERLRLLLELEGVERAGDLQSVPSVMMDLFIEVGKLFKEADEFMRSKQALTSPLAKAQAMGNAVEWMSKLDAMRSRLEAMQCELSLELELLNGAWQTQSPLPLERLAQIYVVWSYLARWRAQLQERAARLAF